MTWVREFDPAAPAQAARHGRAVPAAGRALARRREPDAGPQGRRRVRRCRATRRRRAAGRARAAGATARPRGPGRCRPSTPTSTSLPSWASTRRAFAAPSSGTGCRPDALAGELEELEALLRPEPQEPCRRPTRWPSCRACWIPARDATAALSGRWPTCARPSRRRQVRRPDDRPQRRRRRFAGAATRAGSSSNAPLLSGVRAGRSRSRIRHRPAGRPSPPRRPGSGRRAPPPRVVRPAPPLPAPARTARPFAGSAARRADRLQPPDPPPATPRTPPPAPVGRRSPPPSPAVRRRRCPALARSAVRAAPPARPPPASRQPPPAAPPIPRSSPRRRRPRPPCRSQPPPRRRLLRSPVARGCSRSAPASPTARRQRDVEIVCPPYSRRRRAQPRHRRRGGRAGQRSPETPGWIVALTPAVSTRPAWPRAAPASSIVGLTIGNVAAAVYFAKCRVQQIGQQAVPVPVVVARVGLMEHPGIVAAVQ